MTIGLIRLPVPVPNCGISSYYKIRFHKQNKFAEWNLVYKTEDVHHNLNPHFKKFSTKMSKLCDGDYARPIKIECWDKRHDKDDYIGEVIITIN